MLTRRAFIIGASLFVGSAMLSTRALFTGPATISSSVASLSTSGFWDDIAEPRALYHDGKTYLTWIADSGHCYVAAFDHATGSLTTPVDLVTTTSVDGVIHNSPSLMVRASDNRIIVAVAENEPTSYVAYFVSTNPGDATAFGTQQTIAASVGYPTFPTIYQQDDGDIYYFVRLRIGAENFLGYYKSTDGGSTWGSFVSLLGARTTAGLYWRIGTNGSRFDIFTTDTNRRDADSALYHFYLDGSDDLYQSDGTLVGAAASGHYDANTGSLVKSAAAGSARAEGWAYDASGYPACLVMTYTGSTNTVHVARWSGSAWGLSEVVSSVGGVIGTNQYISSGAMDKSDPDVVFIPVKVGSYFELYRYQKVSGSWTSAALTTGSSGDHAMPDTPLHAHRRLRCVLGYGTYTDDTDFDFTMERYGSTA